MNVQFDQLTGDPLPQSTVQKPAVAADKAVEPVDLTAMESMTKEELIGLVKRVCDTRWGEVALMTKQQRAEAGRLKLWHAGLTEKEVYKALPMLKEAFDRDEGKAAQSIAMTVKTSPLDEMSDDRLLRLERELARLTGQEAIVISPSPKRLED